MSVTIESYCGLKCGECNYLQNGQCKGCASTNGKPFHGKCEVADCATQKKRRFCGECENFPCDILNTYSYDKDHGDKGARIENCKEMKSTLVREARVGLDPISICGHHCDHCFLGQWCGGCRSQYNCCSFATLFEDGLCPNLTCVAEKGLDGCYACDQLVDCKRGYYGQQNEYVAKATALFIKAYGKECYTQTLVKAIESGINYPKSFDATGSVEEAFNLLKSFMNA